MLMASNVLSTLKLNLDCAEILFSKKTNRYGVHVVKKETRLEVFVQV